MGGAGRSMHDIDLAIQAALARRGIIDGDLVTRWIDEARSWSTLRLLYELTRDRAADILPRLDDEKVCFVIRTFLLESIRLDPAENDREWSRYESARVMVAWFYHLQELPQSVSNWSTQWLTSAAEAVTSAYVTGDDAVRECLETGILEHVLEVEELHRYIEHWGRDPVLAPAHARALAFRNANPYMYRSLFGVLRHAQERARSSE